MTRVLTFQAGAFTPLYLLQQHGNAQHTTSLAVASEDAINSATQRNEASLQVIPGFFLGSPASLSPWPSLPALAISLHPGRNVEVVLHHRLEERVLEVAQPKPSLCVQGVARHPAAVQPHRRQGAALGALMDDWMALQGRERLAQPMRAQPAGPFGDQSRVTGSGHAQREGWLPMRCCSFQQIISTLLGKEHLSAGLVLLVDKTKC